LHSEAEAVVGHARVRNFAMLQLEKEKKGRNESTQEEDEIVPL
jgi:hypothetical protein